MMFPVFLTWEWSWVLGILYWAHCPGKDSFPHVPHISLLIWCGYFLSCTLYRSLWIHYESNLKRSGFLFTSWYIGGSIVSAPYRCYGCWDLSPWFLKILAIHSFHCAISSITSAFCLGYIVYSHLMLFVTSLTIWNLLPHNSSMNIVCIVIHDVYCFLLEPDNVYYCRIDCHQVPTAGLCLVPWPFYWIAATGSTVQQPKVWVCRLSEQLEISYYTLMQKASVFSI
jgi:hypothetical protein